MLSVLLGIEALGVFLTLLGAALAAPRLSVAELLIIIAAATIGVVAAFAFARAVEARTVASTTVWVARGLGLVGAAIAVWFPAILFGELRYIAPGNDAAVAMVLGEIRFTVLTLPFTLIPIVVALRMPVAGGVLFLVMSALNVVQGVFDPTGSFPERSTGPMMIIFGIGPGVLVGIALIVAGVAMRRQPPEPPFSEWLRALRLGDRALDD